MTREQRINITEDDFTNTKNNTTYTGQLFKLILDYVNDVYEDEAVEAKMLEELDVVLQLTFEPIRLQLKKDLVKYRLSKDKMSRGGTNGAKHRWGKEEVKRNTPALLKHLDELGITGIDRAKILAESNEGEIGHPIWAIIREIKTSNGMIKVPAKFILSKLITK